MAKAPRVTCQDCLDDGYCDGCDRDAGECICPGGAKMSKGAHPGFEGAAAEVAHKEGLPMENARAIIAAGSRKASAKARRKNPALDKVSGMPPIKKRKAVEHHGEETMEKSAAELIAGLVSPFGAIAKGDIQVKMHSRRTKSGGVTMVQSHIRHNPFHFNGIKSKKGGKISVTPSRSGGYAVEATNQHGGRTTMLPKLSESAAHGVIKEHSDPGEYASRAAGAPGSHKYAGQAQHMADFKPHADDAKDDRKIDAPLIGKEAYKDLKAKYQRQDAEGEAAAPREKTRMTERKKTTAQVAGEKTSDFGYEARLRTGTLPEGQKREAPKGAIADHSNPIDAKTNANATHARTGDETHTKAYKDSSGAKRWAVMPGHSDDAEHNSKIGPRDLAMARHGKEVDKFLAGKANNLDSAEADLAKHGVCASKMSRKNISYFDAKGENTHLADHPLDDRKDTYSFQKHPGRESSKSADEKSTTKAAAAIASPSKRKVTVPAPTGPKTTPEAAMAGHAAEANKMRRGKGSIDGMLSAEKNLREHKMTMHASGGMAHYHGDKGQHVGSHPLDVGEKIAAPKAALSTPKGDARTAAMETHKATIANPKASSKERSDAARGLQANRVRTEQGGGTLSYHGPDGSKIGEHKIAPEPAGTAARGPIARELMDYHGRAAEMKSGVTAGSKVEVSDHGNGKFSVRRSHSPLPLAHEASEKDALAQAKWAAGEGEGSGPVAKEAMAAYTAKKNAIGAGTAMPATVARPVTAAPKAASAKDMVAAAREHHNAVIAHAQNKKARPDAAATKAADAKVEAAGKKLAAMGVEHAAGKDGVSHVYRDAAGTVVAKHAIGKLAKGMAEAVDFSTPGFVSEAITRMTEQLNLARTGLAVANDMREAENGVGTLGLTVEVYGPNAIYRDGAGDVVAVQSIGSLRLEIVKGIGARADTTGPGPAGNGKQETQEPPPKEEAMADDESKIGHAIDAYHEELNRVRAGAGNPGKLAGVQQGLKNLGVSVSIEAGHAIYSSKAGATRKPLGETAREMSRRMSRERMGWSKQGVKVG